MTDREKEWIEDNPDTCEGCGHLEIFHNSHCCEFCMVGGCNCSWGEIVKDDDADDWHG